MPLQESSQQALSLIHKYESGQVKLSRKTWCQLSFLVFPFLLRTAVSIIFESLMSNDRCEMINAVA
jgi:hypothetical protein